METLATDTPDEAGLVGQVRSTVGLLYRRFRSERPEGALGDAALEVLIHLHKNGPRTLKQLSDRAGVAPASMSQSVNRLAADGLVTRTSDASDGRKVLFSTTPEGAELAGTARAQRNAWLQGRLETLSAEDRETVRRACELLSGIVEA
jgi:DNA-binding MarR family transcriptional regulator